MANLRAAFAGDNAGDNIVARPRAQLAKPLRRRLTNKGRPRKRRAQKGIVITLPAAKDLAPALGFVKQSNGCRAVMEVPRRRRGARHPARHDDLAARRPDLPRDQPFGGRAAAPGSQRGRPLHVPARLVHEIRRARRPAGARSLQRQDAKRQDAKHHDAKRRRKDWGHVVADARSCKGDAPRRSCRNHAGPMPSAACAIADSALMRSARVRGQGAAGLHVRGLSRRVHVRVCAARYVPRD